MIGCLATHRYTQMYIIWSLTYDWLFSAVWVYTESNIIEPKTRLSRHDHSLTYFQVWPRVDSYKFSFFVRTVPLWNGLTVSVISAVIPQSFQQLALDHIRVQLSSV